MFNKQLVYLDKGIYLGNYESCSLLQIPTIHISDENADLCKSEDKFIWLESDTISNNIMQKAADKINNNAEILIHCQAGMNRSPTICFMGLLLRGLNTSQAYLLIAERMFSDYAIPIIPCWSYKNLRLVEKFVKETTLPFV